MKQDPAPDVKCRDKFLVQSVIISGDLEFSNVQTIVRCCPTTILGTCSTQLTSHCFEVGFGG